MDSDKLAAIKIKLKEIRESEAAAKKARNAIFLPLNFDRVVMPGAVLCCATTMSGGKCKSRAVCGKYCRRHKF
jgi:hypothetical protein